MIHDCTPVKEPGSQAITTFIGKFGPQTRLKHFNASPGIPDVAFPGYVRC